MEYELFLLIAALLFSLQFLFEQKYTVTQGDSPAAAVTFTVLAEAAAAIFMFILQGFVPEFTWFSFWMSLLGALNGLLFTFCSVRALTRTDLGAFSICAMLGGMLLPFCAGVIFYGEGFSLQKAAALVLIVLSLFLTLGKRDLTKSGILYGLLVFVFNGMAGVLDKIHQSSPLPRVSSSGYLSMKSLFMALAAGAILILIRKKSARRRLILPSVIWAGLYAVMCAGGNLLLLVALLHVPASVQYPLITGGVIVFSCLVTLLQKGRPNIRQLAAAGLALVATVCIIW